jgi:18S rRNA (adenine1779-N6/adenine1780-N6)-dimethyltransferase
LRSVLTTKAALKLLEENRKTIMSLDSSISSDENVKELVENILAKPEYKDKRARNLDLDEFLHLMAAFHEVGIHFTS